MELMHFVWLKVGMAYYSQSLCFNLMLMYRLPFLKAFFSSAHNSLATTILLPKSRQHITSHLFLTKVTFLFLQSSLWTLVAFEWCYLYDNIEMYIVLQHVQIHAYNHQMLHSKAIRMKHMSMSPKSSVKLYLFLNIDKKPFHQLHISQT